MQKAETCRGKVVSPDFAQFREEIGLQYLCCKYRINCMQNLKEKKDFTLRRREKKL